MVEGDICRGAAGRRRSLRLVGARRSEGLLHLRRKRFPFAHHLLIVLGGAARGRMLCLLFHSINLSARLASS
jgi:hypothetical protein